jgi:hypothetical protein
MDSAESLEARPLVTAEPLVAGAVLIGIGSMLFVTGLAINTAAMAAAALRWMSGADVAAAPTEFARQQWTRAMAVTAAGARALRERTAPAAERS